MVGGVWMPDNQASSFIPLQDELDVSKVAKSSMMLEMLMWDPTLRERHTLSMCSLPIQHSFAGAGAEKRGNFYMLEVLGRFMLQSDGLIRGLIFDGHGSHQYIRRCLHGQLDGLVPDDIQAIPFFGALTYEPVPPHGLPRFPMQIARFQGNIILGICGVCFLEGFPSISIL